jgi:hypothetical protein
MTATTAQLFREAWRDYADQEKRGSEIQTPGPAVNDAMRWGRSRWNS